MGLGVALEIKRLSLPSLAEAWPGLETQPYWEQ